MKTKPYLNVAIIAKNEEENLTRCLSSLDGLSCEIILVYNDCTDNTVHIANHFGATCVEHSWSGYIEQKNFALSCCKQEWILSLDADEALSGELKDSITKFMASDAEKSKFNGASFNRCSYFLGKWIKHGDWYPDTKIRLSRRGSAKWVGNNPHDKLRLDGLCAFLKGDLHHYSYRTLRCITEKTLLYSDIFLKTHSINSQIKASRTSIVLRPLWRFFRCYFLRLGLLDGYAGFVIAFSTSYEAMLRHGRLWEFKDEKDRESEIV